MTQDQFYNWLENPLLMDAASIPQIREVIRRYPYFQTAQSMLAKNLRQENHIDQLHQLQLAAIMAPDRKLLHDYLHDKRKPDPKPVETVEEEQQAEETTLEIVPKPLPEPIVVEHDSLYDLIPEPIIYQLETADLPDLPLTYKEKEEVPETEAEPEAMSFSEWLDHAQLRKKFKALPSDANSEAASGQPSRSKIELIEHFLTQQTERPKNRAEFFNPQKVAAKSTEEDFTVVSETLARIYFEQEKYELAKQAYASLSLKYPEKSVYFAARLKEIDDKLNSEN